MLVSDCPFSAESPLPLAVMTTVVSVILFLSNIFGNSIIILAVALDPNKNLRTPFNWLVVNLAAADLIAGIFTDPISAIFHFKLSLGKVENTVSEKTVMNMSFFISCTASSLTISSLAVERYLAVRKPVINRTKLTNKRILFTVVAIWLISLTLPNIYFEVGYILYSFVFANASVVLAITVTCFTYFLMWRKIKGRSQGITSNNKGITSPSLTQCKQIPNPSTARNNPTTSNSILTSRNKMEAKVTETLLVVLIAMFFFQTFPVNISLVCSNMKCFLTD